MQTEVIRQLWEQARESVRSELPESVFSMWIEPLEFLRCEPDRVILGSPNPFSRKWVLDRYRGLIENHLERRALARYAVDVEVAEPDPAKLREVQAERQEEIFARPEEHPRTGHFFKRDYTFDHFVVGNCNRFAYSASRALATCSQGQQNVLFLYSDTGLGKSHLSQAVGQQILREKPGDRVYYMTTDDFTDEMVAALKNNTIGSFKKKFRELCDVLLLEDVHNLGGKTRTQSELGFALDTLLDADKKLIFTSAYMPSEIPGLKDSVASRLGSGLVLNMEKPDFQVRVRILKKKAKAHGVEMPREVLEYLASELTENVRQIEAGLRGVVAKSSLLNEPVSVELAESVVRHLVNTRKELTLQSIKRLVCRYYQVTPEDLVSKSRKQGIVRPRQIAMYLARCYTGQSLQAIGRGFKRRHATALHAIAQIERHLRDQDNVGRQVELLCGRIESGDM